MRDIDNHFGAYNHLAQLPRAEEALFALRKAASCVKPLMRKRGWRVGILSEFLPEHPNLLGLNTNRGEHIQLRLRHPGDANQFLPFEQVLDTLLHELCHIVWGPHDENFHRLWNELRDEWETLQLRGFSGGGFLGKGETLGGSRIPVDEVRRRARAAAQERARLSKNKYDPGHRLGGSSAAQPQSRRRLRDLLANAAQARNKASTVEVDSGCATGTQVGNKAAEDALRNGFRTKAEMDDANSIAIAQALQELYEQEEDDRIYEGLAGPPDTGGLTWDPELGLQPVVSAPSSRSPTPAPPANSAQLPPPRTSSRPASTTSAQRSSNTRQDSAYDINPRGRPVSRLVREAEAQQRRQNHGPQAPTPAIQNWPTSETGANFGNTSSSSLQPVSAGSEDGATWECPKCTFHNHGSMTKCEMCDTPRAQVATKPAARQKPVLRSSHGGTASTASTASQEQKPLGWNCNFCGTFMESTWWTCSQCGLMKSSS